MFGEVFWGVASTFLAFLLGLAWRWLTRFLVNYRARHFWRPLVSGDLSVVLGRFRGLPGFEASGLVGVGDNIALRDLSDHFARIGFKSFSVFYNDHLGWDDAEASSPLRGNLILLGGPDSNALTREVLERLVLGIEFLEVSHRVLELIREGTADLGRPGWRATQPRSGREYRRPWSRRNGTGPQEVSPWRVPIFRDLRTDRAHVPVLAADGDLHTDCGVVIRCPNPFNTTSEVMIFCGSYGYGTWAAVRFVQSREFLSQVPRGGRGMECVLTVGVSREMPHSVQVEILRPLPEQSSASYCRVPRIVE